MGKRRVGSSPLVRGLRLLPSRGGRFDRIIPARAGFTGLVVGSDDRPRDHPRSRGVYQSRGIGKPWSNGSSPLARGLLLGRSRPRRATRIIPARAGFTFSILSSTPHAWDHPRSRGVYSGAVMAWYPCSWIIPARAGFTLAGLVDPRLCDGSSPLARGLRRRMDRRSFILRIIPARAGFTPWRRARSPPRKDHPRSRGVYAVAGTVGLATSGSSPLARGLRRRAGSSSRW